MTAVGAAATGTGSIGTTGCGSGRVRPRPVSGKLGPVVGVRKLLPLAARPVTGILLAPARPRADLGQRPGIDHRRYGGAPSVAADRSGPTRARPVRSGPISFGPVRRPAGPAIATLATRHAGRPVLAIQAAGPGAATIGEIRFIGEIDDVPARPSPAIGAASRWPPGRPGVTALPGQARNRDQVAGIATLPPGTAAMLTLGPADLVPTPPPSIVPTALTGFRAVRSTGTLPGALARAALGPVVAVGPVAGLASARLSGLRPVTRGPLRAAGCRRRPAGPLPGPGAVVPLLGTVQT